MLFKNLVLLSALLSSCAIINAETSEDSGAVAEAMDQANVDGCRDNECKLKFKLEEKGRLRRPCRRRCFDDFENGDFDFGVIDPWRYRNDCHRNRHRHHHRHGRWWDSYY